MRKKHSTCEAIRTDFTSRIRTAASQVRAERARTPGVSLSQTSVDGAAELDSSTGAAAGTNAAGDCACKNKRSLPCLSRVCNTARRGEGFKTRPDLKLCARRGPQHGKDCMDQIPSNKLATLLRTWRRTILNSLHRRTQPRRPHTNAGAGSEERIQREKLGRPIKPQVEL